MTRQNYYKSRSVRQKQEVASDVILTLVREERKIQPMLGARKLLVRIGQTLANKGFFIGRDRFFKLLKDNNLLIKRKRKYCVTTNSNHPFMVHWNLMYGANITGSNQAFVSDITYIRVGEKFVYLALVTDYYSRAIVGWYCNDTLESIGAQKALSKALKQLPAGTRIIHHSDRGCQYCCHAYIRMLEGHQISMTEQNHCYENGKAERVNGILKQEYGLDAVFGSKADALKAVKEAIYLYNNLRPHQALGYRYPAQVHVAA
jgi:putative transposase